MTNEAQLIVIGLLFMGAFFLYLTWPTYGPYIQRRLGGRRRARPRPVTPRSTEAAEPRAVPTVELEGVSRENETGQRTHPAAPSTTPTVEDAVVPFRQWWRELWETVNHLFVLGGTGSGKTTTVRAMVRYIAVVLKHQVAILDPKANIDTWCGLPALTKAEAIEDMLQKLLADFEERLERNAALTEAEAQRAFQHVWIIVDELSFVRDNCPTWPLLIRRLSSMARALNMHLIIINQSATAEEVGLKGRADLLKNFSRLQLSKGVWREKPASLNLDGEVMQIEWHPIRALSQRTPALPETARYRPPLESVAGDATETATEATTQTATSAIAPPNALSAAATSTTVAPTEAEKPAASGNEQRPVALSAEDRTTLRAAYQALVAEGADISARALSRRAYKVTGGGPWRKAAQYLAELAASTDESTGEAPDPTEVRPALAA